jgi:hypothetical protein
MTEEENVIVHYGATFSCSTVDTLERYKNSFKGMSKRNVLFYFKRHNTISHIEEIIIFLRETKGSSKHVEDHRLYRIPIDIIPKESFLFNMLMEESV